MDRSDTICLIPPFWNRKWDLAADNRWEAFLKAADKKAVDLTTVSPVLRKNLRKAFTFSDFIFRNSCRQPEMVPALMEATGSTSKSLADHYRRQLKDILAAEKPKALAQNRRLPHLQALLRNYRNREMVRIALRDFCGLADLGTTTADLSALADACLHFTVSYLYEALIDAHGVPRNANGTRQHLVVVAMGKLGAGELNFSSDIDLIFAFPDSGQSDGDRPLSNDEFFSRLCRDLVQLLGAVTADGFVFRVDMRLRPFGDSGPLVCSFDALENYYQGQGREWERYAWIKAREVPVGATSIGTLSRRLKPFIYRRYLDYGAFESLRDMKQRIALEVRRKQLENNIKLGAGGIREVEFFGQVFQLIRGGVDPQLQQRPILDVLDALVDRSYITASVRDELVAGYQFLRVTENRLQAMEDQQTHQIPTDENQRHRLAASMGFGRIEDFLSTLQAHRDRIHRHFNGLLQSKEEDADKEETRLETLLQRFWQMPQDEDLQQQIQPLAKRLSMDHAARMLIHFKKDPATLALSAEGRSRLDRLMPLILQALCDADETEAVLDRILDLLRALQRRINYLSLMLENPDVLKHLVRLMAASAWVASFVARRPVLLDELLDPRMLFTPPAKEMIAKEVDRRMARLDPDDLELAIHELCIIRQVNTLRIAAADVTGHLPLMRTSDHLSWLAEVMLARILEIAQAYLVSRHGPPDCDLCAPENGSGFAVIAYGKLGGLELGYGSDLDLVFVHTGARGNTPGNQPIENSQFFARLGQRMLHILSVHTPAGRIYEIDMRLRPSGSSGVLVSHMDGFEAYQKKEAWTWEHQALVRARTVAGDPEVGARFEQIRRQVLCQRRDTEKLRQEVGDMRARMRAEHLKAKAEQFHLKQGHGGIVDIEFIVQYLVLAHAHQNPALVRWTDNVRLLETLQETGVLPAADAALLHESYLAYRAEAHRLSLQQKPSLIPLDHFGDRPRQVAEVWQRVIGN